MVDLPKIDTWKQDTMNGEFDKINAVDLNFLSNVQMIVLFWLQLSNKDLSRSPD